jgi:septum formation protein
VAFTVEPSRVDERVPPGRPAVEVATGLALAKARDVAERLAAAGRAGAAAPAAVLGADTLVVLDGRLLGKPASREEARAMLRALRGRTHVVVTGVALVTRPPGAEATAAVESRVTMAAFDDAALDAYVATGEPDDKAGAYAVQGAGGRLVAAVEGCYTNVVGLPLATTARLLRALGLPAADAAGLTEAAGSAPGPPGPR